MAEELQAQSTGVPKKIPEDMNFDFDFKPLTKGLGFHAPAKQAPQTLNKKNFRSKSHSNVQAQAVASRQAPGVEFSMPSNTMHSQSLATADVELSGHRPYLHTSMTSQLMAKSSHETKTSFISKTTEELKKSEMAPLLPRLAAWGVDAIFVVCFTVATILAFIFLGKWQGIEILGQFSAGEFAGIYLTLYSFVYIFYYSILDTHQSQTPGKMLFGLKLLNRSEAVPTFMSCFYRSLLTLLGQILFGILSVWDVPGQLTKTKVVIAS